MDITAIFVLGIVFWSIYKIFDLLVRRKERMAIIEKCAQSGGTFELPKFDNNTNYSRFFALRIGLLLLGMGFGLVGGTMLGYGLTYANIFTGVAAFDISMQTSIMGGMITLWGGLGLFISYIVERRTIRKEKNENN